MGYSTTTSARKRANGHSADSDAVLIANVKTLIANGKADGSDQQIATSKIFEDSTLHEVFKEALARAEKKDGEVEFTANVKFRLTLTKQRAEPSKSVALAFDFGDEEE